MVQIQSTWFPLYDRNPQTYVANIFNAKPGDYQKAVQRIFHNGSQASSIELPVAKPSGAEQLRGKTRVSDCASKHCPKTNSCMR
jgi:hypothetical protein